MVHTDHFSFGIRTLCGLNSSIAADYSGFQVRLGTIHKVHQHFFSDFWHPPPPCQQLSVFQYPLLKKNRLLPNLVLPPLLKLMSAMCAFSKRSHLISSHHILKKQTFKIMGIFSQNFDIIPSFLKGADMIYGYPTREKKLLIWDHETTWDFWVQWMF